LRTVEVRLDRAEAEAVLQDMCVWLEARGIVPSAFASTEVAGDLVLRTEFEANADAEAFADRFAGRMR
jgi:hypothetical protein